MRLVALMLAIAVALPTLDPALAGADGPTVTAVERPAQELVEARVGMPSDLADAWQKFLLHVQFETHHLAIDIAIVPAPADRDPGSAMCPLGSGRFASAEAAGLRRPPRA